MADYYVNIATGNDSNPGTSAAAPWQNVYFAAQYPFLQPGDVVHVAPGNYVGGWTLVVNGTLSLPIVFISDTWRAAKLTGPGLGNVSQAFTVAGNYIQFEQFEMTAPSDQIAFYGTGTSVTIRDCYVHDVCNLDATVNGGAGIDFATGGGSYATPSFGTIDRCLVLHIGGGQSSTHANVAFVHGVYIAAPYLTVTNCIIGDCSAFGVHGFHNPDHAVVTNNTIFACGSQTNSGGAVQIGEDVGFSISGCIVNNNIAYGCFVGFWESGLGSASGNVYNFNCLFNCHINWNITQGGTHVGEVLADPQFLRYSPDGTGDYRLQNTSPCIGTATPTTAPAFDYAGQPRPNGRRYDIGAYMAQSIAPTLAAVFRTRFALYAVNPTTGARSEWSEAAEQLSFSTIAPGGYGDLRLRVRLPNPRIIPQEFRIFSHVALMDLDSPNSVDGAVFLGRWDESGIVLDASDGDLMDFTAQGAAACLQDDPYDSAYSFQTVPSILNDQLTGPSGNPQPRSNTLPLDSDQSAIVFSGSDGTSQWSPVFAGQNIEEVLNALLPLLGDYQWCVWGHPQHRDAYGFPTWQLYVHQRDPNTVSYTGFLADENSYDVRPAIEWSYNVVTLMYRDATTNQAASVTVMDGRLNSNGSQGTAPFPWRRLKKDLSGYHLTTSEATALANDLLSVYMNGGYKISVVLGQVRDAGGRLIPLHQVRADRNIALPELATIGKALPSVLTPNINVFYILEADYDESSGNAPQMTIAANSFWDKTAFQVARLQYREDHRGKDTKHRHKVLAAGETETGSCGVDWGSNAVNGDVFGVGVNFKSETTNIPSSVTLTSSSTSNTSGAVVTNLTYTGFELRATATGGGGFWRGSYKANGT